MYETGTMKKGTDVNEAVAVVEMGGGATVSVTGAATQSMLHYHILEIGTYYLSTADLMQIVGFFFLVDGFRRVYHNRKKA